MTGPWPVWFLAVIIVESSPRVSPGASGCFPLSLSPSPLLLFANAQTRLAALLPSGQRGVFPVSLVALPDYGSHVMSRHHAVTSIHLVPCSNVERLAGRRLEVGRSVQGSHTLLVGRARACASSQKSGPSLCLPFAPWKLTRYHTSKRNGIEQATARLRRVAGLGLNRYARLPIINVSRPNRPPINPCRSQRTVSLLFENLSGSCVDPDTFQEGVPKSVETIFIWITSDHSLLVTAPVASIIGRVMAANNVSDRNVKEKECVCVCIRGEGEWHHRHRHLRVVDPRRGDERSGYVLLNDYCRPMLHVEIDVSGGPSMPMSQCESVPIMSGAGEGENALSLGSIYRSGLGLG
ncbi:hypothetical protein BJ170DRAFT_596458 [Xylariales sp. AK1849]|nr:hypothetical protein BJ170DRAFT_596458 [Xylariales sp. AK1849]